MKVLFLDIDGVLNSSRTATAFGGYPFDFVADSPKFDGVAIQLIRNLCAAGEIKVVVSSAWRLHHPIEEIIEGLDLPVIGATARSSPRGPERGHEIADWLEAHPEVETWAIVDDDDDMLPNQQARFVNTHGHEGLSYKNFVQLAALFGIYPYDCSPARLRITKPHLKWDLEEK